MSKAMVTVGVVIISVLTLLLVNIIQSYSSGNELDYSLLKDTTEAAMLDAIDYSYYQTSGGLVKMDKEKFVESFIKRFANSVNGDRYYNIRFYDINETPPKASIKIGSSTTAVFAGENFDIKNSIDAIIETKYQDLNDSKKVVGALETNSKATKPSWYPSYSSKFKPSIDSNGNISDDNDYYDDGGEDYEPTEAEVRSMFNKNKKKFYEDKELLDLYEFTDVMLELFKKKYNIGKWGTISIEQYCEEMYDSLPVRYKK